VSKRRALSSAVAPVAPVGRPARRYARHCRGSIHGEHVIVALRHFRRRVGVPLLVVWDRLAAHRAQPVRAFLAAHPDDYAVEWLPPCAPDCNPEELCNGAVKQALLTAAPAPVDALHRAVRRGFIRLGRQPAVLHRFFQHVGLAVTHSP
jgi:transposase